jgi:hypothetical protein
MRSPSRTLGRAIACRSERRHALLPGKDSAGGSKLHPAHAVAFRHGQVLWYSGDAAHPRPRKEGAARTPPSRRPWREPGSNSDLCPARRAAKRRPMPGSPRPVPRPAGIACSWRCSNSPAAAPSNSPQANRSLPSWPSSVPLASPIQSRRMDYRSVHLCTGTLIHTWLLPFNVAQALECRSNTRRRRMPTFCDSPLPNLGPLTCVHPHMYTISQPLK